MKNRKNNKGFSLVELIVVVAIMAVLVGVLAPAYLKYVENSKVSKDEANVDEYVRAVEVALTDETVYGSLDLTNDITITVQDKVDGNTTGTSSLDATSELGKAVKASLGELDIDFTSKKYGGETLTIKIDKTTLNVSHQFPTPAQNPQG